MKRIIITSLALFVLAISLNLDIKRRSVLVVLINKNDQMLVNGEYKQVDEICDITKAYISNPEHNYKLSEREPISNFIKKAEYRNIKGEKEWFENAPLPPECIWW